MVLGALLPGKAQAAAPTFQAFSAIAAAANGGADPTVTLPAHVANDVFLLATIVRSGTSTVATPAGWTQIGATTVRAGTATYQFFWRRAASAAETNPLINRTGTTGDVYAAVISYRGAITTGDPWEVKGTIATGTADPSVIPGITTLTPDSLVVVAVAGEDNNNGSIVTTGTNPAAYTEHYVESATGGDGVITFSEAARAATGATGNISVNWNTAIPIGFGGIALALRPPPVPTFEQSAYRFFDNANSTDVGTALAAQDSAATLTTTNAAFRLRVLLHVSTANLAINGQDFKLQFAARSGTCDTAFAGETYADVTAATVIAYNNNATPADGANLTANANDPTHGADTVVNQTYEELNNFTNPAAINSGQDGKWDFALRDNGAPFSTSYCFRVVTSAGAVLNTYSVIPEITTAPRGTVFYFHDATTPDIGTLPGGTTTSAIAPNVTATGASTNRDMDQTPGVSFVSAALTTLGQTTLQRNWFRRFVSRPLAAQTLPTGAWTIQGVAFESNGASNMLVWGAVIKVWRPSTGAVVATLLDDPQLGATEPGGAATLVTTNTPAIAGVAVNEGDVLIVELWAENTQGNNTARTNTIRYDGTTEGSTASPASYLQAPGTIVFHRGIYQSAYRLFNNADSTNVGTALAAQDAPATLGVTGAMFRLRKLLHVADINLAASGQTFKLQFAAKGGGTCAAPTGAYADVTAATVIAFNNNPAPADGANLTANAADPTHGAHTVVNQTYEELNNFTNSAVINAGQDGKWDFALRDNGAPGSTTYCFRVVKDSGAVLDAYFAYPEVTTAVAVIAPDSFNAVEVGADAVNGRIFTKLRASNFTLDIVAIRLGVQQGTFNEAVTFDLVTGGSGGTNCGGAVVTTIAGPANVTLSGGRVTTAAINVATAYPDVRVRIRYPVGGPYTVTTCSSDNFSIRPPAFTVTSTDATNTATSGTPAIKTGANFNLTAAGGAGYTGTPSNNTTGNVTGTPTAGAIGGTFNAAVGGTASGNFFYSEVGNFGLGSNAISDSSFTAVDTPGTDCTNGALNSFSNTPDGSGRYGCWIGSTAVTQSTGVSGFGRFIPDNFNVSYNVPVIAPACTGFSYTGQVFNYSTVPVMTVTARNGTTNGLTNATTVNYAGSYMKFANDNTSLAQAAYDTQLERYLRFDALGGGNTPALDPALLPAISADPVIGAFVNGVGTLTFSGGGGFSFTRSTTTPSAQFDADIALALNVIDGDGVVFAGNPASFGAATSGNGMLFSDGNAATTNDKRVRYGRLRLGNVSGSQVLPLRVPVEAQYWNGTAFITNTLDSCTSLVAGNVGIGNPQPPSFTGTTVSAISSVQAGRGAIVLNAPGAGNQGSVDVALNLGSGAAADACAGFAPAATAGNLAHLRGRWCNPPGSYSKDPSARARFGVSRGSDQTIYRREQ